MDNYEKLIEFGETVYGENWQSPLSRAMGVSSRTIRNYVSGDTKIPSNLSGRLLSAAEVEMKKIVAAIDMVNSDKVNGSEITVELFDDITSRYEYDDEQTFMAAIDEMNNAIYEETFLSDLDAIAKKWSK